MFSLFLIGYHFKKGGSFEIGCSRSGWRNFGRRWTRGVGGLENWTIFTNAIRGSSLVNKLLRLLKKESEVAIKWFSDNMIVNPKKFQATIINRQNRYR